MTSTQIEPQRKRFHWEEEESWVEKRQRLPWRIRRFFKRILIPGVLLVLVVGVLRNAEFTRSIIPIAGQVLGMVLFILIFVSQFILLFWFLARTRSYTIMPDSGGDGISFDDYRGQPEILEQANQIVTLLRGVKVFEQAGGEPLSGLLLEGPPGTGKTWLAQAISTEARVPFLYMDASGLQAMFIGVGPMKVMGLFRKARKLAKRYGAAVIFMDEIDAVGSRGGVASVDEEDGGKGGMFGGGGGSSGGMGVLSTLLIEMDGFGQEHGRRARWRAKWWKTVRRRKPPPPERRVLVIGATNRMGALDPALLRPGRFDKKLRVDVPDMEGRREIFDYYLDDYAHEADMESAILASETPGYTPADIKYLLNESLRYAFFDGRTLIRYQDFMHAKPEHEMGLRSTLKYMEPEAKRRLATYQAGVALAVRLFMPSHRISRITILRQGSYYGHVWHYPAQESYQGLQIKPELMQRVKVAVAGKAAEIEYCGIGMQSTLVGRDLNRAYSLLAAMANAGMLGTMGATSTLVYDPMSGIRNKWTREQARAIEEAYQEALRETRIALRDHAELMEELVDLLLEKEELLTDEVRAFFVGYGLHTPEPTIVRDGEEYHIFPRLEPGAGSPEAQVAT
jgi:cell division protease FtsH